MGSGPPASRGSSWPGCAFWGLRTDPFVCRDHILPGSKLQQESITWVPLLWDRSGLEVNLSDHSLTKGSEKRLRGMVPDRWTSRRHAKALQFRRLRPPGALGPPTPGPPVWLSISPASCRETSGGNVLRVRDGHSSQPTFYHSAPATARRDQNDKPLSRLGN